MSPTRLYLDLLKQVLLNQTGLEAELRLALVAACHAAGTEPDPRHLRDIRFTEAEAFAAAAARRDDGRWTAADRAGLGLAYTMTGRQRLDHLEACLDDIRTGGVRGDLIETGVWRGGCGIFMRGYLAVHAMADRRVWLADSFAGVPAPSHAIDAGDTLFRQDDLLAISRPLVEDAFRRFDLLDDRVRFVEGLFEETLPGLETGPLALLRLDGDLFTSTRAALEALYDRVVPGGWIIIDDYGAVQGCRIATDMFRHVRGITTPLDRVDWTCVAWRKS